jgi:FAD/FMN-containing dehydrogenase
MNVAVFSLPSYEAVQKVYTETKTHLGEILSAFEFFDKQAYDLVRRHQKEGGEADRKVFETEGEFYVLVETGGSKQEHDEEVSYRLIIGDESIRPALLIPSTYVLHCFFNLQKLQGLLENLMENDLILDGVLAQDTTQYHSLWKLRELIPESAGKSGSVYKYDLSVPVPKMYSLVEKMRARLSESGLFKEEGGGRIREIVGYGHIGDGNLHINICADKYDAEIEKVIEPYVYEIVAAERGSISAEHGLGKFCPKRSIHYPSS